MAALQKIRSKSGILVGVLAVALLAFIFPWNEVSSFINRQRDKAFVVDGDVVSTGDYVSRINEFETFQKLISGQSSFDENTTSQIKEYVYQEMVKEMVLDKQAEKLGLCISDEEMRDMTIGSDISPILRQMPFFTDPQTRQFNPQLLTEFLKTVNTDINSIPLQQTEQRAQLEQIQSIWKTIQNMMKYQRLEDKYNSLLANSIMTNDLEVNDNNEASKSSSDIAYVINRYSAIPDSAVSVSDKEIENLYSKRKNNFKNQEDLRKITYVIKEITPSESDFETVKKEMDEAKEKLATTNNPALVVADYSEVPFQDAYFSDKNLSPDELEFAKTASIGDIKGPDLNNQVYHLYKLVDRAIAPDSINLNIISIPEGTDIATANNRADSILNVIKQGKDFGLVATELMPQSNGGKIGWVTEAQLLSIGKDFTKSCFNAPIGDIFKQNVNGQIIIAKVSQKSKPVPKYKLALIQMSVPVGDQTINRIDNEMNQFMADNSDGKNLVKSATEKGYNLNQSVLISGSTPNIDQIGGSRQVIQWAFSEKVGSVKKFDLADYKIIARVDGKIDAGYLPLSEVKEPLKAELIKDKKADVMISDLKAKNLTSLNAYADAIGTKVDTAKFVTFNTPSITGIGHESALNVYAELGQLNKVEGPVKGDNGVIVLDVLNRADQSNPNFDAKAYAESLKKMNSYRIMSQAPEVLKEKMDVKDNRVKFF